MRSHRKLQGAAGAGAAAVVGQCAADVFGAPRQETTAGGRGNPLAETSLNPEQLLNSLSLLEEELESARRRLHASQTKIEELDRRKAETAGAMAVAQRAISDLEQRLTEQREALARLEELEALRRSLTEAVNGRDTAAIRLAESVDSVLVQLADLGAARDAVAAAYAAVRAFAGRVEAGMIPPEPDALRGAWERLGGAARKELDRDLENDLLEAAARSPLGTGIDELPEHLRAAARERRRALINESQAQRSSG